VIAGELEDLRQTTDKTRNQLNESQQRERVLMRRLTAKEQETQDYVVSNYFIWHSNVLNRGVPECAITLDF
jgi:hypothetical protein